MGTWAHAVADLSRCLAQHLLCVCCPNPLCDALSFSCTCAQSVRSFATVPHVPLPVSPVYSSGCIVNPLNGKACGADNITLLCCVVLCCVVLCCVVWCCTEANTLAAGIQLTVGAALLAGAYFSPHKAKLAVGQYVKQLAKGTLSVSGRLVPLILAFPFAAWGFLGATPPNNAVLRYSNWVSRAATGCCLVLPVLIERMDGLPLLYAPVVAVKLFGKRCYLGLGRAFNFLRPVLPLLRVPAYAAIAAEANRYDSSCCCSSVKVVSFHSAVLGVVSRSSYLLPAAPHLLASADSRHATSSLR